MAAPKEAIVATGREPSFGLELLRFADSICSASSLADLGCRFEDVLRPLFGVPMRGLYVIEPWTGEYELVAGRRTVSDFFLAEYERAGREVDVLHAHLSRTQRPAYNLALMSMDEWLDHPLYTKVKRLQDVRQEIQAPVLTRDGVVGTIHIATSNPGRGFTPHEVELAAAVGRVVGAAIERIHYAASVERERDQAQIALDLTGTAVVISDAVGEPRHNDAARRLLADVVDEEVQLNRLLARPPGTAGFSRHLEVELVEGGAAFLHGHSSVAGPDGDVLITVLELERDAGEIPERALVALTPREREVALRVADGLTDREIAERLWLSPHTVRQYVRRIYRKLDVDSRVALTRLLLGRWSGGPG